MKLGPVQPGKPTNTQNEKSKVEKNYQTSEGASVSKSTDKLELSEEAKKLIPIKQKIDDGFYNSYETIRKTAIKILQQLPSENNQNQ